MTSNLLETKLNFMNSENSPASIPEKTPSNPLFSPMEFGNIGILAVVTFLFLGMYVFMAYVVGWGEAQNFELGWLFLLPIIIAGSILFSLILLIFILKGADPLLVLWCLYFGWLGHQAFNFYLDYLHRLNDFLSYPSLVIIAAAFITIAVILKRVKQNTILLWRFLITLGVMVIISTLAYSAAATYSSSYQAKKAEEGRQLVKDIVDGRRQDMENSENALKTGFDYQILLNGKPVNLGLYFKRTKDVASQNAYIVSHEQGLVDSSFKRMGPGEYMLAPILLGAYEFQPQLVSCGGLNPNFIWENLKFRGPYEIKEGETLKVSIDISQQEYDILQAMKAPENCNKVNNINTSSVDFNALQWNSYKNPVLNFQISYPIVWLALENAVIAEAKVIRIDFVRQGLTAPVITLENLYQGNAPFSTLADYWKDTTYGGEKSRKQISINGKPAYQIVLENGNVITSFMRGSDKQIFILQLWITESLYNKIYDKMLSDFQF